MAKSQRLWLVWLELDWKGWFGFIQPSCHYSSRRYTALCKLIVTKPPKTALIKNPGELLKSCSQLPRHIHPVSHNGLIKATRYLCNSNSEKQSVGGKCSPPTFICKHRSITIWQRKLKAILDCVQILLLDLCFRDHC